ncbi:hypothetical protein [Mesorhizobium sp.]|uniref:hypothetical protein n=1 Tax=Mesorhizobium sp. TaxID=1871066 RepID=UPI00120B29F1|nr:hypothetical protein [Mesorhizobium sp.]TIS49175.1 MAG: hypothetical protein E5W96_15680 [Mesorhizobium sp.]
MAGKERLVENGLLRKPELLALERGRAQLRAKVASNEAMIARSGQQIEETEISVLSSETDFNSKASQEMERVCGELAQVEEDVAATEDTFRRTEISGNVVGLGLSGPPAHAKRFHCNVEADGIAEAEAVHDRLSRIKDPDRHRIDGVSLDADGERLFAEASNPDRRIVDRRLAVLGADCDPDVARKLQRDLMKLERRYKADHAFRNSGRDLGQRMRNVDVGIARS